MHDMTPPFDPAIWLDDALQIVTLRLEHEVALTRLLRGEPRQEGFLGLFVSDTEAQAIIGELAGTPSVMGATISQQQINAHWDRITKTRGGIWQSYADRLGLGPAELDLVLLAAAPAVDPRFARVYGYLNDDMAKRHLTPALARLLLDRHAPSVTDMRAMCAPASALLRFGILTAPVTTPFNDTPLHLSEDVLCNLVGAPSPQHAGLCHLTVEPIGNAPTTSERSILVENPKADTAFSASQIAARNGQSLMLCDVNLTPAAILTSVFRNAALTNAHLHLTQADTLSDDATRALVQTLNQHTFSISTREPHRWLQAGLTCPVIDDAAPPFAKRLPAIADLLNDHPADLTAILSRMGACAKRGLAPLITLLSAHRTQAGLDSAVAQHLTGDLHRLARIVSTPFTMDDLIISRTTRRALENIINWRSHAGTILDDWGLQATYGKTRAMTALFKGPSGTGKTMAASVIANALELPLFKVDLATLVSKYIGETERNLDQLFTAAEGADVVLFFDECDAIFGKRSEVSDAHDRYANLETSFLLQRMEQFNGIMILASNLHQNMDDAFLRRIDLVTEFAAPGTRERTALWQRIEKTDAPLADDLDLPFLATTFDLTGGEIRNCCLDAAHRAAVAGTEITMAHLVQAVAREMAKQGRTVHRATFGDYQSMIATGMI